MTCTTLPYPTPSCHSMPPAPFLPTCYLPSWWLPDGPLRDSVVDRRTSSMRVLWTDYKLPHPPYLLKHNVYPHLPELPPQHLTTYCLLPPYLHYQPSNATSGQGQAWWTMLWTLLWEGHMQQYKAGRNGTGTCSHALPPVYLTEG